MLDSLRLIIFRFNMDKNNLAEIIRSQFGLKGKLEMIYSELDQVYSLEDEDKKYVVKLSNPDRPVAILELESAVLEHLHQKNYTYVFQKPVLSLGGLHFVPFEDYHLRIFEWIDAKLQAQCNPQTGHTRASIGLMMGSLSMVLADFEHDAAHRFIKWDPSQVAWIKDHIHLIPSRWQGIFISHLDWLEQYIFPLLDKCPRQVNYNDANDYNVLCNWNSTTQCFEAYALIDWLDTVYTHRINELAITCAYSIMGLADPLQGAVEITSAYHSVSPLNPEELEVLYAMIAARLMISVTVSAINKDAEPLNEYLQISDQAAWLLLEKWFALHPRMAWYSFRAGCHLEPIPDQKKILTGLHTKAYSPIISRDFLKQAHIFDFSIGSEELGNFENYLVDEKLDALTEATLRNNNKKYGLGLYGEIRPFYSGDSFRTEGNDGPQWRTQHLGIDLFAPAGTPVYSAASGKIHSLNFNNLKRDYGPTIITEHDNNGVKFYFLLGHLTQSSLHWKPGDLISAGDTLGWIGQIEENGGWPPHLHFQVILDLLGYVGDFPGVGFLSQTAVWTCISPDPGFMFEDYPHQILNTSISNILQKRKAILGFNLSVSYKNQPLWIQRGQSQYLIDHTGRKYLDTVNNVAHCGHEHPRVVSRGQKSMAVLNTNTRYLHEQIITLAEELKKYFDPTLEVCYFTNSGTEANELAIRLAKNYTRSKEVLTMQWGYHGNSSTMVDLSSYKFDRKGGKGRPPHTHVIPMPDPLRGIYASHPDQAALYLQEVKAILSQINSQGSQPAALFAESILSCGGQIVYPKDFLTRAVSIIREAGGVYIADEVQTGLGRIGSHFSAYELYGVTPDIVTLGKPLGNGHPIGAVLCTREIAAAFNNGMEYFNTFGGNPVSCAIACEVLRVLQDESLMVNALLTGQYLKKELNNLLPDHPILADIRGEGFFLGIELLDGTKPATLAANYLAGRMRTYGILMSTDGPDDNVLKIKPPMTFSQTNAEELLSRMDQILREAPMLI